MQISQRTYQRLLYIRRQRQLGKTDDEIRTGLIGEGFAPDYVDGLFAHVDERTTVVSDLADRKIGPMNAPPDNGLLSFGIGVGIVVAVTVITFVILQFTTDWSVVFWGLSIVGLIGMAKGIYFGLTFTDSARAKAGRVALYAVGLAVVGVCAFWTWTTFYGSTPSENDVSWHQAIPQQVSDPLGRSLYRFNGTIGNDTHDWRLTGLELTVTPLNSSGDPIGGAPIKVNIVPQGIEPQQTMTYSKGIPIPPSARSVEEYLSWEWEKK